MVRLSWLPLLLVMACAHGVGDGKRPGGNKASAQRIYLVAEERYAAGAYDEAVELMRNALLQLPPEPEHDGLRHQLLLRMGHTQLRAYAVSGQAAPLQDAQQMLTRYLERHEQLFGETEAALLERGEVYELLYEVERRLEPMVTTEVSPPQLAQVTVVGDAASEEPSVDADLEPVGADTTDTDLVAADVDAGAVVAAAAPVDAVDADADPETTREPADDDDDDGYFRRIFVRNGKLASIDDPQVREKLRTDFSTGWADLILTAPGLALIHGPRPLVRGSSRLAGPGDRDQKQLARRAGQSLLRDARPTLRSCYDAAFARQPVPVLESKVEASIHPDGSVSHVRIVDGGLVDGYGDACVIEALQSTTIAPLAEVDGSVRVEIALLFFYENAVYRWETGDGGRPAARLPGLPSIEKFYRPVR
jgi:hypothetical protein